LVSKSPVFGIFGGQDGLWNLVRTTTTLKPWSPLLALLIVHLSKWLLLTLFLYFLSCISGPASHNFGSFLPRPVGTTSVSSVKDGFQQPERHRTQIVRLSELRFTSMSVGKAAHTHGSAEFVLISIGNRPLPEIPREPLTISRNRDTIIRLDQLDIDGLPH
jgi:hypothetical protein